MKISSWKLGFIVFCNIVLCKENQVNETTPVSSTTFSQPSRPLPHRKLSKLICPNNNATRTVAQSCKNRRDCNKGLKRHRNLICCNNLCVKGILAPWPEPIHSPALFGLVDRACPNERIPELLQVKECVKDEDCTPRICCPEKLLNGRVLGYCRTAEPRLDRLPSEVQQLAEPFRLFVSYVQCTPPPPPFLDRSPKVCQTPLDCFPNLCCQERGRKFCRPSKRSLITLIATAAQRIVPDETAKNFISRIGG